MQEPELSRALPNAFDETPCLLDSARNRIGLNAAAERLFGSSVRAFAGGLP
ncbi:hypothetical protein [Methylococcus geothermalis]|uniref:hypothetical protein n=1 Tax=Methylococcus geothermalis TaxID=2681310 RepID=UPI001E2CAF74|nr:hypothetical protein [Methylococcus geothermalis]